MFCSTPRTEPTKGRRRQKSTGLLIPVPHCRCCPSRPQLLPVRLCQSLPPQPYALEVSNRVREGLVIASRQPQLGGGDGQRWMMTTMTTATAAVDDHGGATPSPPASLIADAFASLSLLALLVAFGRPETTNARALPRTRIVVVVVAIAVGPPQWALRHDHRWGGRGRLGPREDAAR